MLSNLNIFIINVENSSSQGELFGKKKKDTYLALLNLDSEF